MKKILILIAAVGFQGWLQGQDIVASGERVSVVGPATLDESGQYFLARDIIGPVTIAADDIVLNLNGHVIGGTTGIQSDGFDNIIIQNGVIQNTSSSGIDISNGQNIKLQDLLIDQAGSTGIVITTCTCVLFDSIKVQDGSNGAELTSIHQLVVNDSIFSGNSGQGLEIVNSDQAVIENSFFLENRFAGLTLMGTQSSVIQSCIAEKNDRGFEHLGCFGIRLSNNQSHDNDLSGIILDIATNRCCLQNNITNNNVQNGIDNQGSNNAFFTNKAQQNGTSNFVNVPIFVIFDLSVGDFLLSPTTIFENVSVIP